MSHSFEHNMPGFRMRDREGVVTEFTARIRPFLTHEESLPLYQGQASFEITELTFQTSIGTYLDSPFHRYPDGRDIGAIEITEVVLPGVVIDVRNRDISDPVGMDVIPTDLDLRGKALLFNFGWDKYWGTEEYRSYPYISGELVNYLVSSGVKLAGVDTPNIDNSADLERPAHTVLLKNDILIVENLTGLDQLYGTRFRFFAVPWKARKVAALPVRTFAEVL